MFSFGRIMLTMVAGVAMTITAAGGKSEGLYRTACQNKSDEDCAFSVTHSFEPIDTPPDGPKGGYIAVSKVKRLPGAPSLTKGSDWRFLLNPVTKAILIEALEVRIRSGPVDVFKASLEIAGKKETYRPVGAADQSKGGYSFALTRQAARQFEKHLKDGNIIEFSAKVAGGAGGRVLFSFASAESELPVKAR